MTNKAFRLPQFYDNAGEQSPAASPTRQLLDETRPSKLPLITRRTPRVGAKRPTVQFLTPPRMVKSPTARQTVKFVRTCAFCNRRGDYNSFPDGSVAAAGIFACADCLRSERTATFREAFEIEIEEVGEVAI